MSATPHRRLPASSTRISRRASSAPKPSRLNDYVKYNGEAGAREHGKFRQEGKEYVVHDGDVMNFRFNV